MTNFSAEAKVGLFVIIGIVLIGYMSMKVGKLHLSSANGYDVQVLLDSAAGLVEDVSVEIAGVEIGRVRKIQLKDGRAMLTLHIRPDIVLRKDARVMIRTKGILGDKYIEIQPGTPDAPAIEAGGRLVRTVPATDMDTLMNTLGEVAKDIKKLTTAFSNVLGGEKGEASLETIVQNVEEMVTNLNQTIKDNQDQVKRVVDNLAAFSDMLNDVGHQNRENINELLHSARNTATTMASLMVDLQEIAQKINTGRGSIGRLINDDEPIQQLNQVLTSLRDITDRINKGQGTLGKLLTEEETIQNLNGTLASLDDITGKINRGEGTIGRLVNDEETVDTLNLTLSRLNDYLEKQETFRTYLDYRGEYLFGQEALKSYVSLRIQPKEDKYYLLQVVDDPSGKESVTKTERTVDGTTTTSKKTRTEFDTLKFSAQVAKRYYDLGLRGGLFESTGGVGLDYYLMDDRLVLTFEAFDFSREKNPHLKAGVDFTPFSYLYITTGFDNFISDEGNDSFFFGAGIHFSDEDIKTLMGSVPLP